MLKDEVILAIAKIVLKKNNKKDFEFGKVSFEEQSKL